MSPATKVSAWVWLLVCTALEVEPVIVPGVPSAIDPLDVTDPVRPLPPLTDVTVPEGMEGKVARVPLPRIYWLVVPPGEKAWVWSEVPTELVLLRVTAAGVPMEIVRLAASEPPPLRPLPAEIVLPVSTRLLAVTVPSNV